MKKFTYQVGIDVAKSTLDCTVLQEGKKQNYQRIANTPKAVKVYLQQLKKQGITLTETVFCMEHTGVYNAHILQALYQSNCAIWLEAALRIKESLGFTRGKNDKVDSYRIARYAYLHQDSAQLWIPRRDIIQQLARLTMLRKRLVKTKVALLQPLAETKQFLGNKAFREERTLTDPIATTLKKQIKRVEKQIEEVIRTDEHLNYLFELVTSVEAIGPVTAGHLLVVTNEFRNFTCPKKFACYAGTAPFENSSGTSIRGKSHVSPYANKDTKKLLHMAALSAINMQNELAKYYQRKVSEGKNKMAVINAVRNKLIKRIFAVVERGTKYEKNYTPTLA
jgi:transposase